MRDLLLAFFLGAIIVGGAAFWYETRQRDEFSRALKLLKSEGYATAYVRAMAAYRDEEPTIAIWELTHLAALEQEEVKLGVETKGASAGLMLTYARLAKLYHQQGHEAAAETNAAQAIFYMRTLPRPDTTVTNLPTLLARLQEFDAREKQRRNHEL